MSDVQPIPDDRPRVSPHLSVTDAAGAIDFYVRVLGGTERMRMAMPDGTIMHAEVDIGGSVVMLGDAGGELSDPTPQALGGTPVSLYVYVEDVDAVWKRALDAKAKPLSEPTNHFYGDRAAIFDDPWGHRWNVASVVEDVSPEEIEKRMAAMSS